MKDFYLQHGHQEPGEHILTVLEERFEQKYPRDMSEDEFHRVLQLSRKYTEHVLTVVSQTADSMMHIKHFYADNIDLKDHCVASYGRSSAVYSKEPHWLWAFNYLFEHTLTPEQMIHFGGNVDGLNVVMDRIEKSMSLKDGRVMYNMN